MSNQAFPLPIPPLFGTAVVHVTDHADGATLRIVAPTLGVDRTSLIYWRGKETRADVRAKAVRVATNYLKEMGWTDGG